MKKSSFLLLLSLSLGFLSAQPCTELFFSEYIEGTSNNKAIEIYNPTSFPINLAGYKIELYYNGAATAQNTLNLAGTLQPGSVYVAVNPQAGALFTAAADTLSGFINFNGNDAVALVKGTSKIDVIGIIGNDPGANGWAAGVGFTTNQTLVRRPQVHEGTTDWTISAAQWVVLSVDTSFLGMHTISTCPTPLDTIIKFSPVSNLVSENAGTYNITLSLNQPATSGKTVSVELISGNAADIGNFTTQIVSVAANAVSHSLPITITDNSAVEGNKQFVFKLSNPSPGLLVDADSLFTLTIADDDTLPAPSLPHYAIATVTTVNANGEADSLNVKCSVSGVVYGINLRSAGLQFTIHDKTGGIGVFSNAKTFGYAIAEGDSVFVAGEVTQFSGFTQMSFLDTVLKVGTGALNEPTVVTQLGESTESELIRINNVTLVNPSQWNNSNPAGFSVDVSNGSSTFNVRIDEQTDLFNQNAPQGTFDVIGLGGQFDSSSPFTSGYQINPRYSADIILHTGIFERSSNAGLMIFPNPNDGYFFITLENNVSDELLLARVTDVTGKLAYEARIIPNGSRIEITMPDVAPGLYFVEVSGSKFSARGKMLVKE